MEEDDGDEGRAGAHRLQMTRLLRLFDLVLQRLQHFIDQIELLDQTFPLRVDAEAVLGHSVAEHHRDFLVTMRLLFTILQSLRNKAKEFATDLCFLLVDAVVLHGSLLELEVTGRDLRCLVLCKSALADNVIVLPVIHSQPEEREGHDLSNRTRAGVTWAIRAKKFYFTIRSNKIVLLHAICDFAQRKVRVQGNLTITVFELERR